MKFKQLVMITLTILFSSCSGNDIQRDRNSALSYERDIFITSEETIQNDFLLFPSETREDTEQYIHETSDNLEDKILSPLEKFSNLENIKHSSFSFYAVDLGTDEIVSKYSENKALVPASILKVLTSATALEILGGDTTLKTKLVYEGIINNGVLNGNIYIQGGGDPTLGSKEFYSIATRDQFIKDWVKKVKGLGINSVKGDIIVLDDAFGYEGFSGKWLWEDMGTSYGQSVYGVNIFDNLYTSFFKTGTVGGKPTLINTSPKMNNLKFTNDARVISSGKRTISIKGLPMSNERIISGNIVKSDATQSVRSEIPNPGLFLGQYFKNALKEQNVKISGNVKTSRTTTKKPFNAKTIAITESPKISKIVNKLLIDSNNLYTESLFNIVSKVEGVNISAFWQNKGLNVNSLSLEDGSGLSRGNTMSSKLIVDILKYSEEELDPLLAVAGKDGTVSSFLKETPLDGKVKVKTGSMGGIQSYVGYVDLNEKKYAFSIIVNHWTGQRKMLQKDIENLLVETFVEK